MHFAWRRSDSANRLVPGTIWCLAPGLAIALSGCAMSKPVMVIAVPVADLRAQPHTAAQPDVHDPLQESQLLYGERVRVVKRRDGWAQVEAIEQPEYTHHKKWQGYPGWLPERWLLPSQLVWDPTIVVTAKWATLWNDPYKTRKSDVTLPLGTMLRATDIGGRLWRAELLDGSTVWMVHRDARPLKELALLSPPERRQAILRSATLFVGDRYYWGGRSPHAPTPNAPDLRQDSHLVGGQVTGVDCSGLVNLAYRTVGMAIPRDAHEQYLRARSVPTAQPGDLIFLSEPSNPKRIVHVMLYAGDGELIEGPGTGLAVRRIALTERFGRPLDGLTPGAVVNDQMVFFGSYLP